MNFPPLTPAQRQYLSDQYGLIPSRLDHMLEDIWTFSALTCEAYALKRHEELKASGWVNEKIYDELLAELEGGRFQSRELTARQIRRIIYG
jgi:broad-specificity NMP kinase